MPLYEYRCAGCGQIFEQLRRMQEADRGVACPHCGYVGAERQLSTFASHTGSSEGVAPCGQPASSCGTGGFS